MDSIFRYFISKDNEEKTKSKMWHILWFLETYPESEFQQDDLVMYYLMEKVSDLEIALKSKYLYVLFQDIMPQVIKKGIKVVGTEQYTFESASDIESIKRITFEVINEQINEFLKIDISEEDFITAIEEFRLKRLEERYNTVVQEAYSMMTSRVGKYIGVQDSIDFLGSKIADLEMIYGKDTIEDLKGNKETDEVITFVTDFGIDSIDNDMGGICTTQLVCLEADTGLGKTRCIVGCPVYRALVKYNKNVLYIALEQTEVELKAMLIARHIFTLFNRIVDAKRIWKKDLKGDELKWVEAAKYDLFKANKYGKIHIIADKDLKLETTARQFRHYEHRFGSVDLICVDYVGLVEQEGREYKSTLKEYEVISKFLRSFKKYLRLYSKAGIAINQANELGTRNGESGKPGTTSGAQGGKGVYRSSDFNIDMTADLNLKNKSMRKFETVKARSSEGRATAITRCWLACCLFEEDKNLI